MLRNYLKIAYRNLLKNKIFSFISILGLAVGMAAFLLILQYARFELSYEDFHEHAEYIYRISLKLYDGSQLVGTDAATYWPVGPLLKEQMPEVRDYVRITDYDVQEVTAKDQQFYENRIYFADPSIFTVFSLNVLHGDPKKGLTDPFQAVITSSLAQKYFGQTDVVGEAIQISEDPFQIVAVIDDPPHNTHLKFDMLLSHTTIYNVWDWYETYAWNSNNDYTYLLMDSRTDPAAFNEKLVQLSSRLKDELRNEQLASEPIKNIHLYSNKSYEPEVNGNAKVVYTLLAIAVLIIVIAWVNYVSLFTSQAVERAREVGIRKVMGSVRRQLVVQFLLESLLVSVLAIVLAITFLQLGLPIFRDITGQPLSSSALADPVVWYWILALLGAGVVLAGLYPSLILSSFEPTAVLKGKLRTASHGRWLRRGLVIFQFAAAVVLIVSTVTVYLQIQHLRNQDLGMDLSRTVALRAPSLDLPDSLYKERFQSFKTEVTNHLSVIQATQSESLPGLDIRELSTSTGITVVGKGEQGKGYMYYVNRIDADFLPTIDIALVAGNNFTPQTVRQDQILVNEEALQWLGLQSPQEAIGSQITEGGAPLTIIGVVQNYHQRSPKEPHLPMIFPYTSVGDYFTLKINTSQLSEAMTIIEDAWGEVFPTSTFDYFFLDETYDQQYRADSRFGQVVAIFCGLAIFISCLGLFGLSSYSALQRMKEIGIRKVLGATVGQMVLLLSGDFIRLVLLSGVLALPISYFVMKYWLESYAVRVSLSWWVFLLPLVLIVVIALLTISFQTIKAALANPVDSLRYE